MSSSRLEYKKTFYFFPVGDPNKDKYDDDYYEDLTLNLYREILPIVKSFGKTYNIVCDYQTNDYNPEYHMLEYTLTFVSYEHDDQLNINKYANIKLDFIAIETIMIEMANEHNLVLG